MSFVIIMSFKNMSVTKLLKLQDEIMLSPYDKTVYPDYIEHCEQIVYTQFSFVLCICSTVKTQNRDTIVNIKLAE